jgi:hypothetical protein
MVPLSTPRHVFARVRFAPHVSHLKWVALTGTSRMSWHLKHLTFVVLPLGADVGATLGFGAA